MMSCFVVQLQETLPKLQLEINVLVLENGGNGVDHSLLTHALTSPLSLPSALGAVSYSLMPSLLLSPSPQL